MHSPILFGYGCNPHFSRSTHPCPGTLPAPLAGHVVLAQPGTPEIGQDQIGIEQPKMWI